MKTHPESIYVSTLEVALARKGVPALCSIEPPREPAVEFVPASAYVELRASTDQALQSELAHIKRLLSLTETSRGKLHEEISVLLNQNIALETELEAARAIIAQLRTAEDNADAKLTAIRNALTEAGIPEVEPYPEEDVSERERSLRAGGRAIGTVERIERLSRLLISAVAVVDQARVLDSYDWQSRLDDSKTSADAIEDAHELARMVDNYDRRRTAEASGNFALEEETRP